MQISSKQLSSHLTRSLAKIYLVTGNEMFLQQEASRLIREKAMSSGIAERKLLHDAAGLQEVGAGMGTMSLFAEQTLYEVRFSANLKKADGEAITAWCKSDSDDLLLIMAPQIDKNTQKTAWFKALLSEVNQAGVWLTVWPVKPEELPAWITDRGQQKGLQIASDAIKALAERTEGNLLAANQTLERLALIHDEQSTISLDQMLEYTSDSARFGAFDMIDNCLLGNARKTVRMLLSMREQANPVAVFSAVIANEIRKLSAMAWQVEQGESNAVVFKKFGVWQSKQAVYAKALQRYPSHIWQSLLSRCLSLDKIIKGQQSGDAWLVLESILLVAAGKKQFAKGIPANI